MKIIEEFKLQVARRQEELSKKIIQGTEQTDKNGEFTYSLNDLQDLCKLNQLSEIKSGIAAFTTMQTRCVNTIKNGTDENKNIIL